MRVPTLLAAIDDIEACATIAARVGCDVATVRRVLAEAGHMPAAQLVRLCGMPSTTRGMSPSAGSRRALRSVD